MYIAFEMHVYYACICGACVLLAYVARVCCAGMPSPGWSQLSCYAKQASVTCNAHIITCALQFENDVFSATSEPHGDIEAVVTRKDAMPHAKL